MAALDSALVPIAGEPSTMRWVQLACRDAPEALRFYGEVFGWGSEDVAHAGSVYTNWKIGDRPVAGLVTMDERWPPDYPAHWIPYFQVLDCDASTERAVELGGRMRVPPGDAEMGRFSILTDPTGARFAVLAPTAEAREKFDTRAARGPMMPEVTSFAPGSRAGRSWPARIRSGRRTSTASCSAGTATR